MSKAAIVSSVNLGRQRPTRRRVCGFTSSRPAPPKAEAAGSMLVGRASNFNSIGRHHRWVVEAAHKNSPKLECSAGCWREKCGQSFNTQNKLDRSRCAG